MHSAIKTPIPKALSRWPLRFLILMSLLLPPLGAVVHADPPPMVEVIIQGHDMVYS